jgi:hypothetical protein
LHAADYKIFYTAAGDRDFSETFIPSAKLHGIVSQKTIFIVYICTVSEVRNILARNPQA